MPSKDTEVYTKLSLVYTHLMRDIRYDRWAEYIYNISKRYLTKKARVLDLASGNGLLVKYLHKYYSNLVSTDLSLQMIKNFSVKRIKRIVCDMTHLPFRKEFDLINCSFDSINYLMSEKAVKQLFREVSKILSPSGIFLFDVSLENNSFKHAMIPYSKGTYNGVSYINTSIYNAAKKIHTNTFYIDSDGSSYREVHRQKIYSFETYFRLLERTSLYPAECFEAFSFNEGTSESERLQFVIKKRN